MKRAAGFLIMGLALSGCALSGSPHYRVQTESSSAITILTDPALRGLPQARQVAQSHCSQYGKNAVQVSVGNLRGGQAPVNFACR